MPPFLGFGALAGFFVLSVTGLPLAGFAGVVPLLVFFGAIAVILCRWWSDVGDHHNSNSGA